MKINKAREIAATAWCDKRTSDREMDVELAEVFAELLCKIYRQGRADQNERIETALGIWANQNDIDGNFYKSMITAIRAARPEVKE